MINDIKLNFEGMTNKHIEIFIKAIDLDCEMDGTRSLCINNNTGEFFYGDISDNGFSGYVSGNIFGIHLSDIYNDIESIIELSLKAYKENDFDYEKTAEYIKNNIIKHF